MQYLAEVQKVQGFVGSKSAIKLLARNTNDTWQAVPSDQVIATDPNVTKDYKDGQLVLADITGNNQIQSLQDATRKIISSLQSLSRVQDKFRVAEDEIEQWKQNLQYQAQELHKREQELEQREIELENLDIIREEIERSQQELMANQAQFEQMRQELEARGRGLAPEQLNELLQLCDRLAEGITDPQLIQSCLQVIYDRQHILTGFWQELETTRGQSQQLEAQINSQTQQVRQRRQEWSQAQGILTDMKTEIKVQERLLQVLEQQQQLLQSQILTQDDLHQQMSTLVEGMGGTVPSDLLAPEEVQRLENMAIEDLIAEIARLQETCDKDAAFLGAQEEEIADIEGQIADLRSRIETEKDFAKRVEMEAELSSLQEEYDFQEESVSGQRQSNSLRLEVLNQRKAILERRQNPASGGEALQTLTAMLGQIDDQRQRLTQELKKIEGQVAATRSHLQRQQEELRLQQQQHNQADEALSHEEQELVIRNRTLGEAVSRVAVQEAILRPLQDIVDQIRPILEQIANSAPTHPPHHHLSNLREILHSLSA